MRSIRWATPSNCTVRLFKSSDTAHLNFPARGGCENQQHYNATLGKQESQVGQRAWGTKNPSVSPPAVRQKVAERGRCDIKNQWAPASAGRSRSLQSVRVGHYSTPPPHQTQNCPIQPGPLCCLPIDVEQSLLYLLANLLVLVFQRTQKGW